MSIEKKKPSKELISLINEGLDTGIKFIDLVDKIWKKGAEEGFSREEIAEIVRPIARKKGLNKDQVYYLTHKPELLEKSKSQYEELKTRNIPTNTADTKEDIFGYEDYILDRIEDFNSTEKYILDTARLFRKLGYSEDRIFTETKRMCKSGGMGETELEYVEEVLKRKYDLYQKFDNFPGKQPPPIFVQYLKIAATLDIYGIPRDQISTKIKKIVIPIQGMEYSYFIDHLLQPTPFADPNIAPMDFLGVYIASILPRKFGGYVDDDRYKAEQEEKDVGIGDGIKCKVDEKYCRHCIMKIKKL